MRLVFEPSEESVPGGAVDVIAEGWFDDVAAVFGVHCDPRFDVGSSACARLLTSAADMVEVRVVGPGGHTARPQETVDLLAALGRLLSELPAMVEAGAPGPCEWCSVRPMPATPPTSSRSKDWYAARCAHLTGRCGGAAALAAVAELLTPTGATWSIEHRRGYRRS